MKFKLFVLTALLCNVAFAKVFLNTTDPFVRSDSTIKLENEKLQKHTIELRKQDSVLNNEVQNQQLGLKLILSSDPAFFAFQAGFLQALEEWNIPIQSIESSSWSNLLAYNWQNGISPKNLISYLDSNQIQFHQIIQPEKHNIILENKSLLWRSAPLSSFLNQHFLDSNIWLLQKYFLIQNSLKPQNLRQVQYWYYNRTKHKYFYQNQLESKTLEFLTYNNSCDHFEVCIDLLLQNSPHWISPQSSDSLSYSFILNDPKSFKSPWNEYLKSRIPPQQEIIYSETPSRNNIENFQKGYLFAEDQMYRFIKKLNLKPQVKKQLQNQLTLILPTQSEWLQNPDQNLNIDIKDDQSILNWLDHKHKQGIWDSLQIISQATQPSQILVSAKPRKIHEIKLKPLVFFSQKNDPLASLQAQWFWGGMNDFEYSLTQNFYFGSYIYGYSPHLLFDKVGSQNSQIKFNLNLLQKQYLSLDPNFQLKNIHSKNVEFEFHQKGTWGYFTGNVFRDWSQYTTFNSILPEWNGRLQSIEALKTHLLYSPFLNTPQNLNLELGLSSANLLQGNNDLERIIYKKAPLIWTLRGQSDFELTWNWGLKIRSHLEAGSLGSWEGLKKNKRILPDYDFYFDPQDNQSLAKQADPILRKFQEFEIPVAYNSPLIFHPDFFANQFALIQISPQIQWNNLTYTLTPSQYFIWNQQQHREFKSILSQNFNLNLTYFEIDLQTITGIYNSSLSPSLWLKLNRNF